MRSRRVPSALASAAGAALLASVLTACASDLSDAGWAEAVGTDLNCRDHAVVIWQDHHDIAGDSRPEAFVAMRCAIPGDPQPAPSQLEVFRGDSDAGRPKRLTVLVHREEDFLLDKCAFFSRTRVIVRGVPIGGSAPQVREWRREGDGLKEITPAADAVPACA